MATVTLISAVSTVEKTAYHLVARAQDSVDIERAIEQAFAAWSATPAGKKFLKRTFADWEAACAIPPSYLAPEGILYLAPAFTPDGKPNALLTTAGFQRTLAVESHAWLAPEESMR